MMMEAPGHHTAGLWETPLGRIEMYARTTLPGLPGLPGYLSADQVCLL